MISLSSPRWTDDELLRELRAALREPPVDEKLIRAAQAAFTWRTVDADLEILSLETELAVSDTALVRDAGQGSPRTFTFHLCKADFPQKDLTLPGNRLEAALYKAGIDFRWLPLGATGPLAANVSPTVEGLRQDCQRGSDRFLTEWTST